MAQQDAPHQKRTLQAITSAAGGLIAICLIATGCGNSTLAHTASSTAATSNQELAFSKCMRAHGVPDFPDPGESVNGPANAIAGIEIPTSIDTQSPEYLAAQHGCQGLLSAIFSRQGRPGISASQKSAILAHAQCMRQHGVPDFPDPTFPATGGIAVSDSGTNPQSPAYQHAQAACGT